ncbi:MAG: helix-turn-helix domain-containing protein [Candidatus Omnitrophica bacterium]|nr:helix-turn-helix domain-containing protein [Candidatus Omnitrophota bacterium]
MMNPGLKIYEYRSRRGWTQTELASRMGIAQANLSNIEKGKRDLTVSTLLRAASALEIKPSELIEDEPLLKTLSLTRPQIEALAKAVVHPELKISSGILELAELFRSILPETNSRRSSQKIQHAWTRLRQRFSSVEIRGICQRIEDAKQRTYAKKTN